MGQATGGEEQHVLIGVGEVPADGPAEQSDPPHLDERWGDAVEEDRDDGFGGDVAVHQFQGLDGAVVDFHPQRDRGVQTLIEDEPGEFPGGVGGHGEWSGPGAVVADGDGVVADAVRGHGFVEEAVVVVGAKVTMRSGS